MFRALLRYGTQALIILTPLLTRNWSLVNLWGYGGKGPTDTVEIQWGFLALSGEKDEVEITLRLLLTVLALLVVLAIEFWDLYLPDRERKEFKKEYLKEKQEEWEKKLGENVRINLMFARRAPYFPLVRILRWEWRSSNYAPPEGHLDADLFLTEWQGVSGLALRCKEAKFVDFRETRVAGDKPHQRWPLWNQFHMWPWQLKKTQKLLCILSIPIMRQTGGGGWKAVGVINVDSLKPEGAEVIKQDQPALVEYFVKSGKILACLR